jgi:hypothetical protein
MGYPTAKRLHAIVAEGSAVYGLKCVGDHHNSAASDALIRALARPRESQADMRPVIVAGCLTSDFSQPGSALLRSETTDFEPHTLTVSKIRDT